MSEGMVGAIVVVIVVVVLCNNDAVALSLTVMLKQALWQTLNIQRIYPYR
jgi:hypothetical protein